MHFFSIDYALLAMQNALLREVTPQLRAVIIDLDTDEEVLYARFYYDGEASEQRIDLWDCAVTEASASLGPCFVRSEVERLDFPKEIPSWGYCAYLRKEGDASKSKDLGSCHRVKISEMSLAYALLAVQQALLGLVTPTLRAVVVDFDTDGPLLYIRFYYDGEVAEELIDLWYRAIKEASGYFGYNCLLDGKVERIDCPRPVPFRGCYAYWRKEELEPNTRYAFRQSPVKD
jgi:hypothetical protein